MALYSAGGSDVFAAFFALVLRYLIGQVSHGLGHEFQDAVLPVLVPDQHAKEVHELSGIKRMIFVQQVGENGNTLQPIAQKDQYIGLMEAGAPLCMIVPDVFEDLPALCKGLPYLFGSDLRGQFQLMYMVVLLDKWIVLFASDRHIIQHFSFQSQLRHLEAQRL